MQTNYASNSDCEDQNLKPIASTEVTIKGGGQRPFEDNSGEPAAPSTTGQYLRVDAVNVGAFESVSSQQCGVSDGSQLVTPSTTVASSSSSLFSTSSVSKNPRNSPVSFDVVTAKKLLFSLTSSMEGFSLWKLHVRQHLLSCGFWNTSDDCPVDSEGHSGVLAFLLSCVDFELQSQLDHLTSARAIWKFLCQLPVTKSSVSFSSHSLQSPASRWELSEFALYDLKHPLKGSSDYPTWLADCITVFHAYDAWNASKNAPIDCNNSNLFIRRNVHESLLPLLSPTASASANWASLAVLSQDGPFVFFNSLNRLKNWKPVGDRWTEKHLVALKSAAAELSVFNPNKQAYSPEMGPYLLVQDLLQNALVSGLMEMHLQDIATEIATTRGTLDDYLKIVSNRAALQPNRSKPSESKLPPTVSYFNNELFKLDRGNWKRIKEHPIITNGCCQHGTPIRPASPCLKCYDVEVCAIHAND